MSRIDLELEFLSDAELGSGFATELRQGTVPRDASGHPFVPAPHLKGILRDRLTWLAALRNWPDALVAELLGEESDEGLEGLLSRLRLSDLQRADAEEGRNGRDVITVTRTALTELGVAEPGSLRTTEAIPAGRRFVGSARLTGPQDDALDLLLRLGLRAIDALGGSRTRGAGRCRIEIVGDARGPAALLQALEAALENRPVAPRRSPEQAATAPRPLSSGPATWYRIVFRASAGVCCPETPPAGNLVRSGPSIPASAVQGALLTALDETAPDLATACFADERFRAWPLSPVGTADEVDAEGQEGLHSVRVDLAHRMSKFRLPDGRHDFRDAAVRPHSWADVPATVSLKASDGFLVRRPGGPVGLWRSQDLPRLVSAHAVHGGRRNLFTVEALAPMVFTGILAVPAEAGEALERRFADDAHVAFGKARGVRGAGELSLSRIESIERELKRVSSDEDETYGRVFVVQSPLRIPDGQDVVIAGDLLSELVEGAGWGHAIIEDQESGAMMTQGHVGIRFGWNRHGLGDRVGEQRRLRAERVVLPGSVVVLSKRLDDVAAALLKGIGSGRERGYGALIPHPGIASERLGAVWTRKPPVLHSQDDAGGEGHRLWKKAGGERGSGPSPSQIAALTRRVARDPQKAGEYLRNQVQGRTSRIWRAWAPVEGDLQTLIGNDDRDRALRALRVWQDLAVGSRS